VKRSSNSVLEKLQTETETYQSPSLVILAEGCIFFNASGTFPEKDGRTERTTTHIMVLMTSMVRQIENRH